MDLLQVVRPPMRATFRALCSLNLRLSQRKYRYVFILGHIRSGSTLLAHILANHPNIVGAGEMHVSYKSPADLPKLVIKTCEFLRRPILYEAYIVDQINHPYVSDDVLLSNDVFKSIILIREPKRALASIMKLLKCPESQAVEAYVSRLETLTRYGLLLRNRALLVEYDNLVNNGGDMLAVITSFLDLNSPLVESYATHRMTGRVIGYGDPSENIKIGHIVRTANHEASLSEDALTTAARAFGQCQSQLSAATWRGVRYIGTHGETG
jgi:hypothetical protein